MKTITCTTNHRLTISETPTKDIIMIQSVSPVSIDSAPHYIFVHVNDLDSIVTNLLKFNNMKTKTKTETKKKAAKKPAVKKPTAKQPAAKKAANRKPADRKAAPRRRVEAVITKKEHEIIKKAAHKNEMTITQLVKNWIKSLLK